MKLKIIGVFLCLLPILLFAKDFDGVKELMNRRVPWLSEHVRFIKLASPDNKDRVVLQSKNGLLEIAASSENAAAFGLNWYLKYYCHRSMSHMGDNLSEVSPLPIIQNKIAIDSWAKYRHALNYCTFNYTMSFYSWEDWSHELDWMALNGVNMMLVANGEEAVWKEVLRKMNFSDKQIAEFITGPAFNAWWLMGNIEGWGGPMMDTQIESRKAMVQKMLVRMKSLGIQPVMPGFFGMVPSILKNITKDSIIIQGKWGAFTRPDIINPTDKGFSRIADLFYKATKHIYGEDIHFFSGDPFHEGGITNGVNMEKVGRNIQKEMEKYFPGAIWVLQGWQSNPRKEMLEGVDKSKILIQELFGENTNNWETRKGYEGTPFIWCTVTNFGERPGLFGKLKRFSDEVYRIQNSPYKEFGQGVGIMPEGIDNNPVVYEFLLELGWHKDHVNVDDWIKTYVLARYGKADVHILSAWELFLQTIYSSDLGYREGAPENVLCARPSLSIKSVSSWGAIKKGYDIEQFGKAVVLFAKAAPKFNGSQTFQIDLINFLRQDIANNADTIYAQIIEAYNQKDKNGFKRSTGKFLHLLDLTDSLLNVNKYYRLQTYQKQALLAGNTKIEKKNNLLNLMMLITYWGGNDSKEDNLHEYAYKEWSGLLSSFYKKRWVLYFDYLNKKMNGQEAVAPDFFHWERNWVKEHTRVMQTTYAGSITHFTKEVFKLR